MSHDRFRALVKSAAFAASFAFSVGALAQTYPAPPPPPPAPPPPPPTVPMSLAPPAPPPSGDYAASQRAPRPETVRYEPEESGVSILTRSGTTAVVTERRWRHGWYYGVGAAALYTPLCQGPCQITLSTGAYDMALSKNGGGPVHTDEPVVIDGPSTLRAEYVDHSGLRLAGTVIGLGGIVTGVVLLVVAASNRETTCDVNDYCTRTSDVNDGLVVAGVATILGSAIIGSVLALQRDQAHVFVSPLMLGNIRELGGMAALAPPQGGTIGLRF
jgi:hypothetical protein